MLQTLDGLPPAAKIYQCCPEIDQSINGMRRIMNDIRKCLQRALDIMSEEVKGGMLDGELYRLFVDGKVFEKLAG